MYYHGINLLMNPRLFKDKSRVMEGIHSVSIK